MVASLPLLGEGKARLEALSQEENKVKEPEISTRQAREIRYLLRRLDIPVPADLAKGMRIVDAGEFIQYLRKRCGLRRSHNPWDFHD